MPMQIQLRRGTAAEWTSSNPVLAEGEIGLELDTALFKLGDGVAVWNSLAYGGLVGPHPDLATHAALGVATVSALSAHAATPHNASSAPAASLAGAAAKAKRTSGDVTVNGGSWANFDTGLDLVLNAVAGDWIEYAVAGINGSSGQATDAYFDVATWVSGAAVNYFAGNGGATSRGCPSWVMPGTRIQSAAGSLMYIVQAGDIAAGQVTLRLRVRQDTVGAKSIQATAINPFIVQARNLG